MRLCPCPMRFNAREGIFAFRTFPTPGSFTSLHPQFQCPRGHFCFSDAAVRAARETRRQRVSMPARAFLLFGRMTPPCPSRGCSKVSMPARAFLLFGQSNFACWTYDQMFQCPRGHFCFSDCGHSCPTACAQASFNAREGIFAFRTNHPRGD